MSSLEADGSCRNSLEVGGWHMASSPTSFAHAFGSLADDLSDFLHDHLGSGLDGSLHHLYMRCVHCNIHCSAGDSHPQVVLEVEAAEVGM